MDDKVKIRCPACKQMFRERMNRVREGVQLNCLHCNKLITLSREFGGFVCPPRNKDSEGYAHRSRNRARGRGLQGRRQRTPASLLTAHDKGSVGKGLLIPLASKVGANSVTHHVACLAEIPEKAAVYIGSRPCVRRDDSGSYPALTAFFRQARCTAQVQPCGCEASSFEAISLAGVAAGAAVGIASFTERTSAD